MGGRFYEPYSGRFVTDGGGENGYKFGDNNPTRERVIGDSSLTDADYESIYGSGLWGGYKYYLGEGVRSVLGDQTLAGLSDGQLYAGVGLTAVGIVGAALNPHVALVGALFGLNYWIWTNTAAEIDDFAHNRPINPANVPNNLAYWQGAAVSTAAGGLTGGAIGLAALSAPGWAFGAGSVALGGYGAYAEGGAALGHFGQGNYFQGGVHLAFAGLSTYGGYLGARSGLAARSVAGVVVESEGPFGTSVITARGPGATSVAYAAANATLPGKLQLVPGLTTSTIAAAQYAAARAAWEATPGQVGRFSRTMTPWGRNIWQRPDINWALRRPDGLTNLEAAQRGYAPLRQLGNGFEEIQLHHLNQNPSGGLAEVFRSTHQNLAHNVPPPSWRVTDPAAASAFRREVPAYWRWRAIQVGGQW